MRNILVKPSNNYEKRDELNVSLLCSVPQQSNVSKRRNRTIIRMTGCLLFESKMLKRFWVEAISTLIYIWNHIYSKTVEDNIPFQIWHRLKPSLEHLEFFSIFYFHVHEEKIDKLDKKKKKNQVGVLVGYNEVTKSFWVLQH